jgi:hypothetical protein
LRRPSAFEESEHHFVERVGVFPLGPVAAARKDMKLRIGDARQQPQPTSIGTKRSSRPHTISVGAAISLSRAF